MKVAGDSMFSIEAVVWLVLAVVFVVLELVATAYILPLAIGAAAALVATLFGVPLLAQLAIFAVVAVACYFLFKPDKQQKMTRSMKKLEEQERDE